MHFQSNNYGRCRFDLRVWWETDLALVQDENNETGLHILARKPLGLFGSSSGCQNQLMNSCLSILSLLLGKSRYQVHSFYPLPSTLSHPKPGQDINVNSYNMRLSGGLKEKPLIYYRYLKLLKLYMPVVGHPLRMKNTNTAPKTMGFQNHKSIHDTWFSYSMNFLVEIR